MVDRYENFDWCIFYTRNFCGSFQFFRICTNFNAMSTNASQKRSSCTEDTTRNTKTARAKSPVVVEPIPISRFSTYEAVLAIRNMVWGEAVKSGEYKLYVLVLFLWAARIAGSSFNESGVSMSKRLPCRLFQ